MQEKTKSLSALPKATLKKAFAQAKTLPKTLANKKTPSWKRWILGIFTAACAGVIFWIFFLIFNFFAHFSLGEILMLFGSVETDKNNRTQILLLGSGDANHDSPDLTDTVMVISLNHTDKTISVISIPRDLWIKDAKYGENRVNKFFELAKASEGEDAAYQRVKQIFGDLIGQDIQYFAKVDFTVFKGIVDSVDGVDVTLPYKLCDEQYPDKFLQGYDPFCIDAGTHHIDGEMALRLARSRHGVNMDANGGIVSYSSDFDRASRQQMIIKALKDKVLGENLLTSPTAVKGLYDTYSQNVKTDLGFREVWALAGFAKTMDKNSIAKAVFSVQETTNMGAGALLYYPERALYGGASVVRPLGENFKNLQKFVDLLFSHADFFIENAKVEILNGTGAVGIATRASDALTPMGFNVTYLGNTRDKVKHNKTICYFPYTREGIEASFPATRAVIRNFVPCVIVEREANFNNPEGADITIELGDDANY